ncbi:hypothetical protein CEXT_673241 [Caerostris extrusa]|uniref:Secreted protein n=1 Tax=Caerostris extrusa TaxID=172846 RepID=A0AAV4Y8A8_CAEEX|nr:hypothetical protein CEXT_673241 [Caerostris extrusa]
MVGKTPRIGMLSSVWVSLFTKGLCHPGWPATKSLQISCRHPSFAVIRPLLGRLVLIPRGVNPGKARCGHLSIVFVPVRLWWMDSHDSPAAPPP